MPPLVRLLCVLTLQAFADGFIDVPDGPLVSTGGSPLKIGSFNIRIFGQTKYKHEDVMTILTQIVSRYDVVTVLEIRDSSMTVFENFRQDLNNYLSRTGSKDHFEKVESARLGRTSSKEQYGFLYRPSRVTVTSTYQYTDRKDYFEREPFGVRFSSPHTVIKDFAMVAVHIQPSHAAVEIGNLTKAYESFQRHWHLSDILIAGDFNSDCNYLSHKAMSINPFRTDHRFTWLVSDDVDTTVATSDCSYDRFVTAGSHLKTAVVPGSVKVYRFDETMHLNQTMAEDVSDHYPIEMQLKGASADIVNWEFYTEYNFGGEIEKQKNDLQYDGHVKRTVTARTFYCSGSRYVLI